jgi:hypothetical protein
MVMQCRMCSQRLTRPGKLCRECDRELARARSLTASTEGLAAMPLPLDPSAIDMQDRLAWTSRLTSRTAIVVGAFVIGSALAAALYTVEHARASGESVMLGDLRHVEPVERPAAARFAAVSAEPARDDAQGQTVDASAGRPTTPARAVTRPVERRTTIVFTTPPKESTASTGNAAESEVPTTVASTTLVTTSHSHDRVLGLADALDVCSREPLFVRIECEQRARGRFCMAPGANEIPQCAERPLRDYGQ